MNCDEGFSGPSLMAEFMVMNPVIRSLAGGAETSQTWDLSRTILGASYGSIWPKSSKSKVERTWTSSSSECMTGGLVLKAGLWLADCLEQ
jgi:hypothetical protein